MLEIKRQGDGATAGWRGSSSLSPEREKLSRAQRKGKSGALGAAARRSVSQALCLSGAPQLAGNSRTVGQSALSYLG